MWKMGSEGVHKGIESRRHFKAVTSRRSCVQRLTSLACLSFLLFCLFGPVRRLSPVASPFFQFKKKNTFKSVLEIRKSSNCRTAASAKWKKKKRWFEDSFSRSLLEIPGKCTKKQPHRGLSLNDGEEMIEVMQEHAESLLLSFCGCFRTWTHPCLFSCARLFPSFFFYFFWYYVGNIKENPQNSR